MFKSLATFYKISILEDNITLQSSMTTIIYTVLNVPSWAMSLPKVSNLLWLSTFNFLLTSDYIAFYLSLTFSPYMVIFPFKVGCQIFYTFCCHFESYFIFTLFSN